MRQRRNGHSGDSVPAPVVVGISMPPAPERLNAYCAEESPLTRDATTPRSPRRQPRWKKPQHLHLVAVQKQLYVTEIMRGATHKQAAEIIGRDRTRINGWRNEDPDFADAEREAEEYRDKVAAGILRSGLTRAAEVMIDTLNYEDADDPMGAAKLRKDAAKDVLKGHGLLVERSEVHNETNITVGHAVELVLDQDVVAGAVQTLLEAGVTIGQPESTISSN